jgi:hypothetical protein
MGSDFRYSCAALAIALFACSGSSDVDRSSTSSGGTPGAGTGTGGGPPTCGADALTETNLGVVFGARALVADGADLFYTANPDDQYGDPQGKPAYVAKLPAGGGTPVTLATNNLGELPTLRVDEANVYFWARQVTAVPKAGGMPTLIGDFDVLRSVEDFAIDAASIFYFDRTSLYKLSKQGGKSEFLYSSDMMPKHPLVDGNDLYFVGAASTMVQPDGGVGQPDVVYRKNTSGDLPTKVTELTSDKSLGESITQIAVDGDILVFSAMSNDTSTIDVTIYTVPKSGGSFAKLATGGAPFAVQGGTVYYTVYGSDSISLKKVPVGGGAPADLGVRTRDGVSAMSLDAANLYWSGGGCIYKTTR